MCIVLWLLRISCFSTSHYVVSAKSIPAEEWAENSVSLHDAEVTTHSWSSKIPAIYVRNSRLSFGKTRTWARSFVSQRSLPVIPLPYANIVQYTWCDSLDSELVFQCTVSPHSYNLCVCVCAPFNDVYESSAGLSNDVVIPLIFRNNVHLYGFYSLVLYRIWIYCFHATGFLLRFCW